ncbi:MAG: hypothetical protein IPM46_00060 [Flavobacteriales bacterium]|nr:hypothetical protein [Flavobacteriales bacterium]
MNRTFIASVMLCAALSGGCLKDELDVDSLTYNALDPANTSVELLIVDSITTVSYAQGQNLRHDVHLHVNMTHVPSSANYTIVAQQNGQDLWLDPASEPQLHRYIFRRYLVQSGETYCYDLRLRLDGHEIDVRSPCAVADL